MQTLGGAHPGILKRVLPVIGPLLLIVGGESRAVEPGVDIATPRVAIVTVNNTISFIPTSTVVEPGDYVRWQVAPGTSLGHTTTSGEICGVTTGLWDVNLNSVTPKFTRQFNEAPGDISYFCRPHCFSNMRGNVNVTPPIVATAAAASGIFTLTWSGGSGLYKVFRSGSPAFPAPLVPMSPDGNDAGTSFTDFVQPAPGSALFYLVINE